MLHRDPGPRNDVVYDVSSCNRKVAGLIPRVDKSHFTVFYSFASRSYAPRNYSLLLRKWASSFGWICAFVVWRLSKKDRC